MHVLRFLAVIAALGLAACGGGSTSPSVSAPVPAVPSGPGPVSPSPLPSTVFPVSGGVIGTQGTFTPSAGNMASGGQGGDVDGVPCLKSMDEAHYHVHAFLGIVVNGQEIALPHGVGMVNPGPEIQGFTNTATCFYYLHTHDEAGIIHIEDPSTASRTTSLHTFGEFLDIWGITLNATQFGPYTGQVKIYTSGQAYQGQGSGTVSSSAYTEYTGDPRAIALYGHEVIWIEVGPAFVAPDALPSVAFQY